MATWPASLPQSPLIEGFSDEPQDSVIRTKLDGFSKQRNRYTAVIHDVEESYLMTPSEFAIFRDFYTNTTNNGSEDFTKPDPIEGVTRLYRFTAPYGFKFNGVQYVVKLNLEKLP